MRSMYATSVLCSPLVALCLSSDPAPQNDSRLFCFFSNNSLLISFGLKNLVSLLSTKTSQFFKYGPFRAFFFPFVFSLNLQANKEIKFLGMVEFEPRISGVEGRPL